jgi:preprotein translocase subunit SecF
MKFLNNLNIDFIGKRNLYFLISLFLTAASVAVFVVKKGPILSIEFTGGTMIQVAFKELPPIEDIRKALDQDGWKNVSLQTQPASSSVLVKVKLQPDKSQEDISSEVMISLQKTFSGNVHGTPDRVEFIGSVIGKHIVVDTMLALMGSAILIIIYVGFRFRNWLWGVAGVMALAHDVFITYAFLTFLNAETTLVVVAALLTLAGFSINDTIVIFDRVRENLRSARKEDLKDIYNRSLNETLSRTFNTSFTTLLAALSLLLLGGPVLRDFSIIFAFGVIIGIYSTVGVALSFVYVYETRRKGHLR